MSQKVLHSVRAQIRGGGIVVEERKNNNSFVQLVRSNDKRIVILLTDGSENLL